MNSKVAYVICVVVLLATHLYYPKWSKTGTEATISWDVSGYYMYLPAVFIYNDLKDLSFRDMMMTKYRPTGDFQQARYHEASGHYVMKYAMGQAVIFSPFFLAGHTYALLDSSYAADGYTLPYQIAISIGMLLLSFIGLFYLRRVLVSLFDDTTAGLGLLAIVIGSNYLNYAGIDGAMTHNTLFTIYALLLYQTLRYYKRPSIWVAISIGGLVGLAALTRPTEIIAFLIPMLWGIRFWRSEDLLSRVSLVKQYWPHYASAALACLAIGSLQIIYWKWVSGDWLVYSYGKQGFDWLSPNYYNCLFSYKAGWFTYSPIMVLAVIGFIPLYRQDKRLYSPVFVFCMIFAYIAFSWSEWWYGGSLGQRALIQGYPVFAIALCAGIDWIRQRSAWIRYVMLALGLFFCYVSVWFVHQTHHGGLIPVSQVKAPYYWKVFLTYDKVPEHKKLLDRVDKLYEGTASDSALLYEAPNVNYTLRGEQPVTTIRLDQDQLAGPYDWLRAEATFAISAKEWNMWLMTQFVVRFINQEQIVEDQMYRVQRLLPVDIQTRRLWLDVRPPNTMYTHMELIFDNSRSEKSITISDVKVWGLTE